MKTFIVMVLAFLSLAPFASAADQMGKVGSTTVRYWQQRLDRYSQTTYIMGASDVLVVDCNSDIVTVGAIENALRARIASGVVQLNDLLWDVVNSILLDFGCRTIIDRSPPVPIRR